MTYKSSYTFCFKPIAKCRKPRDLLCCKTLIRLVSLCKMRKHTLYLNICKPADLFYRIDSIFIISHTDARHSRINRNVDRRLHAAALCGIRKLPCRFIRKDRRAHSMSCHPLVVLLKRITENHHWLFDTCLPKLSGFARCCDCKSPYIIVFFHHPRNRHRAVTVTVRFHDRYHPDIIFYMFLHTFEILCDSIQIYISGNPAIHPFPLISQNDVPPFVLIHSLLPPQYRGRSSHMRPFSLLRCLLKDRAGKRQVSPLQMQACAEPPERR